MLTWVPGATSQPWPRNGVGSCINGPRCRQKWSFGRPVPGLADIISVARHKDRALVDVVDFAKQSALVLRCPYNGPCVSWLVYNYHRRVEMLKNLPTARPPTVGAWVQGAMNLESKECTWCSACIFFLSCILHVGTAVASGKSAPNGVRWGHHAGYTGH